MAVDCPAVANSYKLHETGMHEASCPHIDSGEASLSVTSMECCRPEGLAGCMQAGYRRDIGLHYSFARPAPLGAQAPEYGLHDWRSFGARPVCCRGAQLIRVTGSTATGVPARRTKLMRGHRVSHQGFRCPVCRVHQRIVSSRKESVARGLRWVWAASSGGFACVVQRTRRQSLRF